MLTLMTMKRALRSRIIHRMLSADRNLVYDYIEGLTNICLYTIIFCSTVFRSMMTYIVTY
jgi:hypothetical protein